MPKNTLKRKIAEWKLSNKKSSFIASLQNLVSRIRDSVRVKVREPSEVF